MRRRIAAGFALACFLAAPCAPMGMLACSSTHASPGGPPDGSLSADGSTEAGTDDSGPVASGDDGACSLGLPDDSEGCIGADAGWQMVTSDGKPLLFAYAAPDPATGDWQAADGDAGVVAQVFYSTASAAWEANLLAAFDQPSAAPVALLQGTPTSCSSMTLSGSGWTGTLQGGHLTLQNGTENLDLQRVLRPSPTLCQPPPAGAVVLFDGTSFDPWGTIAGKNWLQTGGPSQWKLVDGQPGGAMEVVPDAASIVTKQSFGACTIHAEFRTLGTPTHSGVFPEARYQITVLQTYGLLTGNVTGNLGNESPVVNPTIHADRPPLEWQTLDIDFRPPGSADAGTSGPVVTVRLNGVTVFDSYALTPPTGAAASFPPAPTGPILLEYHGMPLQYRNIWVAPAGP
jgi:hypothetical protein